MEYKSEHVNEAARDGNAELVRTTIVGRGVFPPGTYHNIELASIVPAQQEGMYDIALSHPLLSLHVERIAVGGELPEWATTGASGVSVEIGLTQGVYAKKNRRGEVALFDADTHHRISDYTRAYMALIRGKTLARPTIKKLWRGDINNGCPIIHLSIPTETGNV